MLRCEEDGEIGPEGGGGGGGGMGGGNGRAGGWEDRGKMVNTVNMSHEEPVCMQH